MPELRASREALVFIFVTVLVDVIGFGIMTHAGLLAERIAAFARAR